jgi:chorismate-pyruvate lyase
LSERLTSNQIELKYLLGTTQSATDTLAEWVGVTHLDLARLDENKSHRLTELEQQLFNLQPGITHAYQRTGVLYTPMPGHRPVAWVKATVLLHFLPTEIRTRVTDAKEPLGKILAELPGYVRETSRVSGWGTEDWSGMPVGVQCVARLSFGELPRPVAVVTENVYQTAVERRV